MTSVPDLAGRLGLHRAGRDWRGNCPCCGYADALVLTTGRNGTPIGWCASCQDRDGLRMLLRSDGAIPVAPTISPATTRRERALALWRSCVPAPGTLADRYLIARGLPGIAVSPALRFRPDCHHPEARGRYPVLIALVTNATGEPVAVHRTYLRRDGAGKADIEPSKASLGPVWGCAVRLDPVAGELVVAEGVETAASAARLIGLPAWAAISAGNLGRGLVLPAEVQSVVIAVDRDPAGEAAARAATARWQAEGRRIRWARPHQAGADMSDVLMARGLVPHA